MKNRVSVIIPTFNRGSFIGPCLESVLSQEIENLEIIVVDDGSTDNTRDRVKSFTHQIKYVYQKNAGPSAARNSGISNSTGEWFLFLDSDDILGPNLISSQLRFLHQHPDVFISIVKHENITETVSRGTPRSFPSNWTAWRDNLDVHMCFFNIAQLGTIMFNRKVIMETGEFDTSLPVCEDYDFLFRAILKGFTPRFNPVGLIYHRKHVSSLSQNSAKMCTYDNIMHWRVSSLLDRNPDFPSRRRLEGLLAFASGVILTASRLDCYNLEGADELLELALTKLKEAHRVAKKDNMRSNVLTKLFMLRIFSHITSLNSRHRPTKGVILNNARLIRRAIGAPTSNLGNMLDILIAGFYPSSEFPEERREIRKRTKNSLQWSRLKRLFGEVSLA